MKRRGERESKKQYQFLLMLNINFIVGPGLLIFIYNINFGCITAPPVDVLLNASTGTGTTFLCYVFSRGRSHSVYKYRSFSSFCSGNVDSLCYNRVLLSQAWVVLGGFVAATAIIFGLLECVVPHTNSVAEAELQEVGQIIHRVKLRDGE